MSAENMESPHNRLVHGLALGVADTLDQQGILLLFVVLVVKQSVEQETKAPLSL